MLAGEVTAETLESIERTVRDAANPRMRVVLVGAMNRLQLRNRAHAVAYAFRTGVI
ncbi:hypothetical protein ACH4YO_31505 [Streptomyces noursei]|uniref:hypothetical protein n=1 Tax=Streptomyces noursei TaxID=1971 RepID=UPI003409EF20